MKYVAVNKRSKKEQREFYNSQRKTWGELSPVTKIVPNKKHYKRERFVAEEF